MARGGHQGRGGRSQASRDDILTDSTTNATRNETSHENEDVNDTNPGSQLNNGNSQNPSQDGRIELCIVNGLLNKSSDCSRIITKIFKERMEAEAYTWKKVSKATKSFYFEEFKKHCVWDLEIEAQVKIAWDKKASERYTDFLRDIRRKAEKPTCMTDDVWRSFREFWDTPMYKSKADKNRQNRLNGEGSKTHTGGSISYVEHADRLEAKFNRPPTPFEVFCHTHTKKHDNVSFIDDKAKSTHDKMLHLRQAREEHLAAEGGESQQVNELELYFEAAGGVKKKKVYGVGSLASTYYMNSGKKTSDASSSYKVDETTKLKRKVDTLQRTIEMICSRIGIPVPCVDGDGEGDSNQVDGARNAQNPNSNHSEVRASEGSASEAGSSHDDDTHN